MKSQKIGFLQLEILEIVGIAMIVGSEKYIAKSNIERVLFVLHNPVIFLFKRTFTYLCGDGFHE